jgi:site-specific DNA-methyltransferase (adenine-specific)
MPEKVVIGNAELWLGDCMEILPTLGKVDAVITDPPYGIGSWSSTGGNSLSAQEAADANAWDVAPDAEVFAALRAISDEQVFWGGNYFIAHLGNCRSPLLWDKKNRGMHYADGEFAWTSFKRGTLRIYDKALQGTEVRQDGREHPTQKPIGLMAWCMDKAKVRAGETVLDPYMGSGSTGVAAMQTGRKFIGVEMVREYFDIACERISRAQAQGTLLPPEETATSLCRRGCCET